MEDLFSTCTIKAHLMYELVILTTEFGKFEFSRTFSLLLLPDKKCGKIQIKVPKMSKSAGKVKLRHFQKIGVNIQSFVIFDKKKVGF